MMARAWRRGDVCWCDLEKRRPVVIVTRDALVEHLGNVTVAPLMTESEGVHYIVVVSAGEGVAAGGGVCAGPGRSRSLS